jgi:hypothetical protein
MPFGTGENEKRDSSAIACAFDVVQHASSFFPKAAIKVERLMKLTYRYYHKVINFVNLSTFIASQSQR